MISEGLIEGAPCGAAASPITPIAPIIPITLIPIIPITPTPITPTPIIPIVFLKPSKSEAKSLRLCTSARDLYEASHVARARLQRQS